jgi:hypothetical protein
MNQRSEAADAEALSFAAQREGRERRRRVRRVALRATLLHLKSHAATSELAGGSATGFFIGLSPFYRHRAARLPCSRVEICGEPVPL